MEAHSKMPPPPMRGDWKAIVDQLAWKLHVEDFKAANKVHFPFRPRLLSSAASSCLAHVLGTFATTIIPFHLLAMPAGCADAVCLFT